MSGLTETVLSKGTVQFQFLLAVFLLCFNVCTAIITALESPHSCALDDKQKVNRGTLRWSMFNMGKIQAFFLSFFLSFFLPSIRPLMSLKRKTGRNMCGLAEISTMQTFKVLTLTVLSKVPLSRVLMLDEEGNVSCISLKCTLKLQKAICGWSQLYEWQPYKVCTWLISYYPDTTGKSTPLTMLLHWTQAKVTYRYEL